MKSCSQKRSEGPLQLVPSFLAPKQKKFPAQTRAHGDLMTHSAQARLLNSWGAAAACFAGLRPLFCLGLPSESSPPLFDSLLESREQQSPPPSSPPSSAFRAAKPVAAADFYRLLSPRKACVGFGLQWSMRSWMASILTCKYTSCTQRPTQLGSWTSFHVHHKLSRCLFVHAGISAFHRVRDNLASTESEFLEVIGPPQVPQRVPRRKFMKLNSWHCPGMSTELVTSYI